MNLREYQVDAVDAVETAWARGRRAPLLAAPTGSGKTIIAVSLIQRALDRGQRVLFLAPRRELIDQAYEKLDTAGLAVNVLMAGDPRRNDFARVTVASVDTLHARRTHSGGYCTLDPDLIVVDECHLFVTPLRAGLIGHWPNARIVGLTATPARKDGRALALLFDELIEVATVAELTKSGFLVPARYFSLSEPDLSRVRVTAGDYNAQDLDRTMNQSQLVADVVRTWMERAGGRRTVVFGTSIAHSAALCADFKVHGVKAEHLDANTPTDERRDVFARFRSGETQVLTNCTLASYGFDLPELDCVVFARPTKSLVLYLQMLGRGLRPAPGKEYCLVLDHSGVVHRFGYADEDRGWSLEGKINDLREEARREKKELPELAKLRDCPECQAVFSGSQCPACGWFRPAKGVKIETLSGELVELSGIAEPDRDKLKFYLQLLGEFEIRGKKAGAAWYSYQDKFGEHPPRSWAQYPPMQPGDEVKRWVRARMSNYAKGQRSAPTVLQQLIRGKAG